MSSNSQIKTLIGGARVVNQPKWNKLTNYRVINEFESFELSTLLSGGPGRTYK